MSTITAARVWIVIFIVGLVVSGITAFPLAWEVSLASQILHDSPAPEVAPVLVDWIDRVHHALEDTARYPFLSYGTDWLAFAHLVIAVAFVGPLVDPVRNIWVLRFGMIACAGIVPLALIAGAVRRIPLGWQLIDISFGVLGIIPLLFAHRHALRLEREASSHAAVASEA
jgi:hypothetical protein